jgi:Acyl carrier protein
MLRAITVWTVAELATMLERPVAEIDSTATFAQLGIDSGMATHLLLALEDKLQIELDPDKVAELPTIDALCAYAVDLARRRERRS